MVALAKNFLQTLRNKGQKRAGIAARLSHEDLRSRGNCYGRPTPVVALAGATVARGAVLVLAPSALTVVAR